MRNQQPQQPTQGCAQSAAPNPGLRNPTQGRAQSAIPAPSNQPRVVHSRGLPQSYQWVSGQPTQVRVPCAISSPSNQPRVVRNPQSQPQHPTQGCAIRPRVVHNPQSGCSLESRCSPGLWVRPWLRRKAEGLPWRSCWPRWAEPQRFPAHNPRCRQCASDGR